MKQELSSAVPLALCSFLATSFWWIWRSHSCHQRDQQQKLLFGIVHSCECTLSEGFLGWRGISFRCQIHNLSRHTPAAGLNSAVAQKYHWGHRAACRFLCTAYAHCSPLVGPTLTDIGKHFLLTSNCLGCNLPFYCCPFCILCFRYVSFRHKRQLYMVVSRIK